MPTVPLRRNLLLTLFALAIGVSCTANALAADEATPLRNFQAFEGHADAPNGTVTQFAQDERGMLWIVQNGDPIWFDGKTFQTPPGGTKAPRPGQTTVLAVRRAGGMHVGHLGGVSLWDGRRWTLLRLEHGCTDIVEGEDGTLWVTGEDGRVRSYDSRASLWTLHPAPLNATGVTFTRGSAVVAWSTDLAFRVDSRGAVPIAGGAKLPGRATTAMSDQRGTLWVGSADGSVFTARASDSKWNRVALSPCLSTFPRTLAEDRRGRVWIGDNSGQLCHGNETNGWTAWGGAHGLKNTGLLAVFFDRGGSLWLGYNSAGIQQNLLPEWSHRTLWKEDEFHPGPISVSDIAPRAAGGFYASVFQKGLWQWDGSTMRAFGPEHGLTEDLYAVHEPRPGTIWAGARYGLFESLDGGSFRKTLELKTGFVAGFFRSPDGIDYAGTTRSGVFALKDGTWTPAATINAKLLDPDARKMLWRNNGELWIATRDGVTIFANEGVRYLRAGQEGMPSTVSDLLAVSDDEVWISGSGGIHAVGKDGGRWMTDRDGLPGRRISAMGKDRDGAIWVSGGSGVARLQGGKVTRWGGATLVGVRPLMSSLWIDPNGEVYVGTVRGLSHYRGEDELPAPPPLTLFWKSGPATGTSNAGAPDEDRVGHWTWSAANLRGEQLEYRYRLAGVHDGWSEPQSEPTLNVTNLPPGRWRLEVVARRAGAAAWSTPLIADFEVQPHPWETLWARLAMLAAGLLAVATIVRLRTRRHRMRASELDREVSIRTAELRTAYQSLEEANEKLGILASTDALTGLPNRASFDATLRTEWERAVRGARPLAMILCDVDHFKRFNDLYGHPAGDVCLQGAARAFRRAARRPSDFVARYGGEEFVFVLPETDLAGAIQVADRILREIAAEQMPHAASPVAAHVTVSLGVAAFSVEACSSAAELLAMADAALYEAKDRGRNRWQAIPDLRNPAAARLALAPAV